MNTLFLILTFISGVVIITSLINFLIWNWQKICLTYVASFLFKKKHTAFCTFHYFFWHIFITKKFQIFDVIINGNKLIGLVIIEKCITNPCKDVYHKIGLIKYIFIAYELIEPSALNYLTFNKWFKNIEVYYQRKYFVSLQLKMPKEKGIFKDKLLCSLVNILEDLDFKKEYEWSTNFEPQKYYTKLLNYEKPLRE